MRKLSKFTLLLILISFVLLGVFVGCPGEVDPPADEDIDVTSVTLNSSELFLELDKTVTLEATVLPGNATNKAVTWSSSDATKAEVSNAGVVTAKAIGEATITVTTADGDFTATCVVTVIPAISVEAGVEAQDFGVWTTSGVMGYTVGFGLKNAKASDVASVVVELLDDDGEVLGTTTTTGLLTEYPDNTSLSAPFDVFGEFDYEDDGNWDYSGWEGDVDDLPAKAKITVTFKNGVVKTAENVMLTGATGVFSANVAILNQATGYTTIQDAINATDDGDTVLVLAEELSDGFIVTNRENLTIRGAGKEKTTLTPTALIQTNTSHKYTNDMKATVFVNESTGITIENFIVTGGGLSPDAIVFWNSSKGIIKDVEISDEDHTGTGIQTGQGMAVDAASSNDTDLELTNVNVSGFNKNGIDVINGNGAQSNGGADPGGNITFAITGGVIKGAGSTNVNCQNGIVIWDRGGAKITATINGVTLKDLKYTGIEDEKPLATGILDYTSATGTSTVVIGDDCDFVNVEQNTKVQFPKSGNGD